MPVYITQLTDEQLRLASVVYEQRRRERNAGKSRDEKERSPVQLTGDELAAKILMVG